MARRPRRRTTDEARPQISTTRPPGAHVRSPRGDRTRTVRAVRALLTVAAVVVSSGVVGVAMATQTPARTAAPATVKAVPPPSPGTYRGLAFDACTAPTAAQMKAWGKSPYRGIVVYFGGSNRGCKQPALTAAWVRTQRAAGWHLIPVYVGPQPSCTFAKNRKRLIPNATPVAVGYEVASDAVTQARKLGMGPDSALVYDLEPYRSADPACRAATLSFLSAWTVRLHDLGYLSGLYSGTVSGVPEVVAAYDKPGFVRPDYLDLARWDNVQTLTDKAVPAGYWTPKRRMKQFKGPHKETWGGITITIDTDYLDLAPLPRTRVGDFNGNGWSDLLVLRTGTSTVELHGGTGSTLNRRPLATGWRNVDAVTRLGDINRDGRDDVIARERSTGHLWLYPGTGTGFGSRIKIGNTGWNAMSEITAVGDLTGDGYGDLMAVHTPTGTVRLYAGRGSSLGKRLDLAIPRGLLDELAGVGDVDGDGRGDLVARVKATGALRLYSGRATGLGPYRELGPAGGTLSQLVGVGDFDRNGGADLMAVDTVTGAWFRYPIGATGLGAGTRMASGAADALIF